MNRKSIQGCKRANNRIKLKGMYQASRTCQDRQGLLINWLKSCLNLMVGKGWADEDPKNHRDLNKTAFCFLGLLSYNLP